MSEQTDVVTLALKEKKDAKKKPPRRDDELWKGIGNPNLSWFT